jgi:hypothetical protein
VKARDVGVELGLDAHPFGVADEQLVGGALLSLVSINSLGCSRPDVVCGEPAHTSLEALDLLDDLRLAVAA